MTFQAQSRPLGGRMMSEILVCIAWKANDE